MLRPDVASALPEISSDGLAWTFHLLHGLHYAPPLRDVEITAPDFVRSQPSRSGPVTTRTSVRTRTRTSTSRGCRGYRVDGTSLHLRSDDQLLRPRLDWRLSAERDAAGLTLTVTDGPREWWFSPGFFHRPGTFPWDSGDWTPSG